jgi:hypothetical protein
VGVVNYAKRFRSSIILTYPSFLRGLWKLVKYRQKRKSNW